MSKIDPHNATLDECRDGIAKYMGWRRVKDVHGGDAWRLPSLMHDPHSNWSHPVQATIDTVAESLPKGWAWDYIRLRCNPPAQWFAKAWKGTNEACADADIEILARARACLAAWIYEECGGSQ